MKIITIFSIFFKFFITFLIIVVFYKTYVDGKTDKSKELWESLQEV